MDKIENKSGSWNIEPAEPILPVYPVHSVEFPTLGDFNIEWLGTEDNIPDFLYNEDFEM